jgi:hypothetical protein
MPCFGMIPCRPPQGNLLSPDTSVCEQWRHRAAGDWGRRCHAVRCSTAVHLTEAGVRSSDEALLASATCRVSFNRQQRIRSYKENAPQLTLSSVAVQIGSMGPAPQPAAIRKGAARGGGNSQEPAVLQLVVEASYRNCSVSFALLGAFHSVHCVIALGLCLVLC